LDIRKAVSTYHRQRFDLYGFGIFSSTHSNIKYPYTAAQLSGP